MIARMFLVVQALGLSVLCLPQAGLAQDRPKEEKKDTTLKVGSALPFLVVDFEAGPHKGHCGCPSVMIKNTQARAIVIWSRAADGAVFQLARAAEDQGLDGKKTQGYLVLFKPTDKLLRDRLDKSQFKGVTVGQARHSSEETYKPLGIDPGATSVVFLVDNKEVKAFWVLQPGELTREKSDLILKETASLLKREPSPSK
jgi:hypothetical protein